MQLDAKRFYAHFRPPSELRSALAKYMSARPGLNSKRVVGKVYYWNEWLVFGQQQASAVGYIQ